MTTQLDLRDHVDSQPAPEGVLLGAHIGTGDPRMPMLSDHVDAKVVVPPAVHRSHPEFTWPMLGNDTVGDCVIAERLHGIQHTRLVNGGQPPAFTDQDALSLYTAITGWNPGDPSTDRGTDPAVAYRYWQQMGVKLPDGSVDKLAGSAQILPRQGTLLRRAIWEFDAVGLCVSLPLSAQGQAVWDVAGDPATDPAAMPGGWGGHDVCGVSFDANRIAFYSWGRIMLMTWRFWGTYGSLALAGLSPDLIGKGGVSETGVNYTTLGRDLTLL